MRAHSTNYTPAQTLNMHTILHVKEVHGPEKRWLSSAALDYDLLSTLASSIEILFEHSFLQLLIEAVTSQREISFHHMYISSRLAPNQKPTPDIRASCRVAPPHGPKMSFMPCHPRPVLCCSLHASTRPRKSLVKEPYDK